MLICKRISERLGRGGDRQQNASKSSTCACMGKSIQRATGYGGLDDMNGANAGFHQRMEPSDNQIRCTIACEP